MAEKGRQGVVLGRVVVRGRQGVVVRTAGGRLRAAGVGRCGGEGGGRGCRLRQGQGRQGVVVVRLGQGEAVAGWCRQGVVVGAGQGEAAAG